MKKYLLVALLILSFFLVLSYIQYVLLSLVLTGLVYPIYLKLSTKFPKPIAATLALTSLTFVIILFLYFTITTLSSELINIISLQTLDLNIQGKYLSYIESFIPQIVSYMSSFLYNFISNIVKEIIGYIISLILSFYILIHAQDIKNIVINLGLSEEDLSLIVRKFYGVFVGHILVWILQSILSYIGFILLNIKFAFLLSIIVFIFAILPLLGPWTVWILVLGYLLINNLISLSQFIIYLFYGVAIVTVLPELMVRPIIVGKTAEINPAIVILGVLGGLNIFGLSGIFIGPLILEYTKDFLIKYLKSK